MTPHTDRPMVYVAGPYAFPESVENCNRAIHVADTLQESGLITAYVPHLNLVWNLVVVHDAAFWYDYDLAFLARCDALFRINGFSEGSDKEVEFAHDRDIPVFYEAEALFAWAKEQQMNVVSSTN